MEDYKRSLKQQLRALTEGAAAKDPLTGAGEWVMLLVRRPATDPAARAPRKVSFAGPPAQPLPFCWPLPFCCVMWEQCAACLVASRIRLHSWHHLSALEGWTPAFLVSWLAKMGAHFAERRTFWLVAFVIVHGGC